MPHPHFPLILSSFYYPYSIYGIPINLRGILDFFVSLIVYILSFTKSSWFYLLHISRFSRQFYVSYSLLRPSSSLASFSNFFNPILILPHLHSFSVILWFKVKKWPLSFLHTNTFFISYIIKSKVLSLSVSLWSSDLYLLTSSFRFMLSTPVVITSTHTVCPAWNTGPDWNTGHELVHLPVLSSRATFFRTSSLTFIFLAILSPET